MTEPLLTCPECGSERVTTEHHQMFLVNTGGGALLPRSKATGCRFTRHMPYLPMGR